MMRHVTWKSFLMLLLLAPKLQVRICWILGQFWIHHFKICWRTPVPGKCGLASLGYSVTHVKIWGGSTPLEQKQSSEKIHFGWVKCAPITFLFVDQTRFFLERGRDRSWSVAFPIYDISTRSQHIRYRSLKLSKIAPNFGRFLPFKILGGRLVSQEVYQNYHASRHVTWKSFLSLLPLAAKLQARIRRILSQFLNVHS